MNPSNPPEVHPTPSQWDVKKIMDDLAQTERNSIAYGEKKSAALKELEKQGYAFGKMRSESEFGLSKVGDSGIVEVPKGTRRRHPLLKRAEGGAAHIIVVGRAHGYTNGRDVAVKSL
jgi:hypothetical protein